MKKLNLKKLLSIIILFIAFPLVSSANDEAIEKFFEKYSELDGVTYVNFTPDPGMLNDIKKSDEADTKEMQKLFQGLRTVKILTTSDTKSKLNKEIYEEALKVFPMNEYKKFMEIKDGGEKIKMLYKEGKSNESEFLMLVLDKNELTIIWIKGSFDIKDLPKLQNMMGTMKGK